MAEDKWTVAEIGATVAAYFGMLRMHERGEHFVKATVIRELRATTLQHRTKSAVERRFHNISAVLQKHGSPWLKGYVPNTHYPESLIPAVLHAAELVPLRPTLDLVELDKSTKLARALGPLMKKPKGQETPESTPVTSKVFKRDPLVRAYVLEEAGGKCELCDHSAPFEDKEGDPFLEVHHVKTLAEGGADTVENSVAVCPNCHRSLHLAKDREQRRVHLYAKVSRLGGTARPSNAL